MYGSVPLVQFKDVALKVNEYRAGKLEKKHQSLLNRFYAKRRQHEKYLLKDINLNICSGDRIALIGRNGAGKTTLLKLLARSKSHSLGEAIFNTSKIFFIGNHQIGFSPKATLVENIYLNGLSKGIPYKVLKDKENKILQFAELGDFSSKNVNTLSAGQRVRLALSISLHADADLYLIDEWVGALDHYFFTKFNSALVKKLSQSKALIIASHNEHLLKRLCNQAMVVENGMIKQQGEIDRVLKENSLEN